LQKYDKILVAMSGGVDSTVVAYLLQQKGYEIEGVYMKLHDNEAYHAKNIKNIKKISKYLGINYHILDIQKEFKEWVFDPFVKTYEIGETPNPCIVCNRNIKLGKLIEFTKKMGFDTLATGHYVKVEDGFISEAKDESKDQSYFLSNIKIEALKSVIFPLGNMLKSEVREIANSIDILQSIAKQKESSEICFVPGSYLDILKDYYEVKKEGVVVDCDKNPIGKHFGYMRYTIGQRKGFRVDVAHEPHYVTHIDAKNNQITVGTKDKLYKDSFKVRDLNLFIDMDKELECAVKIRYRSPKVLCKILKDGDEIVVKLDLSLAGIAPSQVAAFYIDNHIIGSGIIQL